MSRILLIIFSLFALSFEPFTVAKAGSFQYHATRRAVARSIAKQGADPAKFRATSRFGAGFYTANRQSTALAEKGRNSAVLRFKKSGYLKKNAIDLTRPNSSQVRSLVGTKAN